MGLSKTGAALQLGRFLKLKEQVLFHGGRSLGSMPQRLLYRPDPPPRPLELHLSCREDSSNPSLFHRSLVAQLRAEDKRSRQVARRNGYIPSSIRGCGKIPDMLIQVPPQPFTQDFQDGLFSFQKKTKWLLTGPLYELRVEEGARDYYGNLVDVSWVPFDRIRVQPVNIRIESIKHVPHCVQFTYCPEDEPVRVHVPIRCINTEQCPGLRSGGWLNRLIPSVDIQVAPFVKPPLFCTLDVGELKMKEKLRVRDLVFEGKGEGCRTILPEDEPTTMVSKA